MDRILIGGAGITGALCANFLSRVENSGAQRSISIWDKARGAGGRMSTARAAESFVTADLGAQYFTPVEKQWEPRGIELHRKIYRELQGAGVLMPLRGVIKGDKFAGEKDDSGHFVAVNGSSSIVKHFLGSATNVQLGFNKKIVDVSLSADGQSWSVKSEDGESDSFSSLVLTTPIRNLLEIGGDLPEILDSSVDDVGHKLRRVVYSSRYAVAAWFGPEVDVDAEDWVARYIDDDPVIRYVAVDPKKRGVQSKDGTSIVVHTTVPFGLENIEKDMDEIKKIVMDRLSERVPFLKSADPLFVKCLRWRCSQVHRPYEGVPGCLVVCRTPPLILAGDAFVSTSNFDGCVDSASAVSRFFEEMCAGQREAQRTT